MPVWGRAEPGGAGEVSELGPGGPTRWHSWSGNVPSSPRAGDRDPRGHWGAVGTTRPWAGREMLEQTQIRLLFLPSTRGSFCWEVQGSRWSKSVWPHPSPGKTLLCFHLGPIGIKFFFLLSYSSMWGCEMQQHQCVLWAALCLVGSENALWKGWVQC